MFGLKLAALAGGILLCSASLAHAQTSDFTEELIHERISAVEVELNEKTVLCSAADYGAEYLKVLIPKLAGLTLLDHQNTGAGAPCVAAGQCAPFGDASPADVLNSSKPTEVVDVKVSEFRANAIDHVAKTCETYLIERVNVNIRGVPFTHERSAYLGPRPYGDCL